MLDYLCVVFAVIIIIIIAWPVKTTSSTAITAARCLSLDATLSSRLMS